jgi:NitT/TauT family transport system substrate-binding protein
MLGGVEASPRGRSGCSPGDVRHGVRGILPRASLAAGLGLVAALVAFLVASMATSAVAADRIRIVAQKTGTLAWELDIIRTYGLDKQADLDIQVVELASTEAGRIALASGSADLIVSDWLWVARERSLGARLVYYPYSSTLGAVMAPATSGINGIADLKGKKLAIAGGPLDKSWLMLQAVARRAGLDLKNQAKIVFGAPPLLSEKALQGEHEATLTYWNFCAELEGKGLKRAIDMEAVEKQLGAGGPVALLGYAFDGDWAAKNKSAVDRFLRTAAKAKEILASSEAEWQRLAPRIGVSDKAALEIYRKRYNEGIPRRSVADEERDSRALYLVLAEIGGTNLVGTAREMDKGTFYDPGKAD